ncbi:hypothetical protein CR513_21833, partial [Mucuna pruriens]
MYPIECYMKILKGYVKNPNHPKSFIVKRYIVEEVIEFCSVYMSIAKYVGVPKSRDEGRCAGKGTQGVIIKNMSQEEVLQAHLYILINSEEAQPYLSLKFSFYTKLQNDKSNVQNNDIKIFGRSTILNLECLFLNVTNWVDSNMGVKTNELGFTWVDFDKSFVMESQAKYMFYVNDMSNKRWLVVLLGRSMHGSDKIKTQ